MTDAKVTLKGKLNGYDMTVEVTCAMEDIFVIAGQLAMRAKEEGWKEAYVPRAYSGGKRNTTSKLVLDRDTNRVKLYPHISLIYSRDNEEETKTKREAFQEAVQAACGVNLRVGYDGSNSDDRHNWVGLKFAPNLWQDTYFKDWEKEPADLPEDLLGQK